ncbi:hypothetical protein AVEN_12744-1 [Araneus ventricosus]|uniref:Uncharacterized protein n=1 Tax=Araneus ventricosus TaxID=182803 RepID=A0A4Y2ABA8_ARAVE|nr:hypothetical protein AVEN_12744-1 [Araneus ventricosus]
MFLAAIQGVSKGRGQKERPIKTYVKDPKSYTKICEQTPSGTLLERVVMSPICIAISHATGNSECCSCVCASPFSFSARQRSRTFQQTSSLFVGCWIGHGGPIACPSRSPDLFPIDFFLWGFLRTRVRNTCFLVGIFSRKNR